MALSASELRDINGLLFTSALIIVPTLNLHHNQPYSGMDIFFTLAHGVEYDYSGHHLSGHQLDLNILSSIVWCPYPGVAKTVSIGTMEGAHYITDVLNRLRGVC